MIKIESGQIAAIPNTTGRIRNIHNGNTLVDITNCLIPTDFDTNLFAVDQNFIISKKNRSFSKLITADTGASSGRILYIDIQYELINFCPIYYLIFPTHNNRKLSIEKDELISYVAGRSLQDIYPIGFYINAPIGHIYVAHLGHNKVDEQWGTELWSSDVLTVNSRDMAFTKDDWRLTPSS